MTTRQLKIEVLGPLRAWYDHAELDLGSPQQRAVLAVLALSQGWQVSIDGLIGALWGQDPPRAAAGTVRTYVSRLRRRLDPVTGNRAGEVLRSIGDGYTLEPDTVTVDTDLFARYLQDAQLARRNGDTALAASLLRDGLAIWRGAPLAGIQGPYADAQRARLTELRMAATEDRLAMEIESGEHMAAVAELRALLDEYPLREKLSELMMLALYRAGRQADALAVYADSRRLLRDELGIDPGPALREVHERVLRADITLAEAQQPGDLSAPPPAQLPPPLADFTGRADILAAVAEVLTGPPAAPLVAITGMPGIGKTALAVQAANDASADFPDGQLYAELTAVDGTPAHPGAVLAGFLAALGRGFVPGTVDELIPACRAAFAGRRMLVVLDDAHDTAQVRSLLPALAGCAVIITTARRMIGLPRAGWFEVGRLRPDEAITLLERVVGRARVAAERGAAERLVDACACQPLAIRTTGLRLAARPGWRILAVLRHLENALTEPAISHPDCELVAAPLELAYRRLADDQRLVFRQAALSGNPEISVDDVMVLTGLPQNPALALLESLADVYLIEAGAYGDYGYDPLVKVFARRMALAIDGHAASAAVQRRLHRCPQAECVPA